MSNNPGLLLRQDATAKARERMMQALLDYRPCRDLKVNDLIFIADWCSTVAFDAIREVDEKENRA